MTKWSIPTPEDQGSNPDFVSFKQISNQMVIGIYMVTRYWVLVELQRPITYVRHLSMFFNMENSLSFHHRRHASKNISY